MRVRNVLYLLAAAGIVFVGLLGHFDKRAAELKGTAVAAVEPDVEDQIRKLRLEVARVEGELNAFKVIALKKKRAYWVDATAYSASVDETDSTPRETATLTQVQEGRTLAVSQDHVDWLGRRVYIPGYGVRVVEDLMNKRFTDRIDFFIEGKARATAFGKKRLQVILLD